MDFRLAIAQQILAALPEAQLEAADVASIMGVDVKDAMEAAAKEEK